ncbi:MAG TPA: hypothetical protein VFJ43_03770 [Bacteroidia bacterium]|nr:hypothetical protein [Bacteroidia bacterium]
MRLLFSIAIASSFALTLHAQTPTSSVALTSFNAVPREKQVLLSWNPDQVGVVDYELEKSKNGSEFIPFGNVQGAENETEFIETDFTPFAGLSYYRLKLTSSDGTVSYSNVVPVKYGDNGLPESPVSSTVIGNGSTLQKDKSVLVIVRSAQGEEYYSKVEVESTGDPITCKDGDPTLASGTYTIIGCSEQELYAKQIEVK